MERDLADAGRVDVNSKVIDLFDELSTGKLDESTVIATLDIDSLLLSYVFAYFERACGVEFNDDDLLIGRYVTIGDLCDAISARIRAVQVP